jgi:hypothetical protein
VDGDTTGVTQLTISGRNYGKIEAIRIRTLALERFWEYAQGLHSVGLISHIHIRRGSSTGLYAGHQELCPFCGPTGTDEKATEGDLH